jgi:DNA-binding transcriptional ArsR family regulator
MKREPPRQTPRKTPRQTPRKPPRPKTTHEHPQREPLHSAVGARALERAARLFRAAGEVSRLRLLERLAGGEWCVTELAAAGKVGLSTVSQQLRVLKAEHLVRQRREGKHIYYSLADRHIADLIQSALEHASERPQRSPKPRPRGT